jgi:RNA polymerase sigma factor (sigma-70 family)
MAPFPRGLFRVSIRWLHLLSMEFTQDSLTDWMNRAGQVPVLPKSEVLRISKLIHSLEKDSLKRKRLISKLVLHNMRLVVTFVSNFMRAKSAHKWGSTESLDYLQVGVLGLYKAAEKFDPERGYAFSTYATHWIRSTVGRYNLRASSPFKISEEACRCAYSYEKHGKISEFAHVSSYCRNNPAELVGMVRSAQSPASLYSETDGGGMMIDHLLIAQPESIEFYENGFNPQIEKLLIEAGLNEIEDAVIRSVFIDGLKKDEVCDRHQITSSEFLKTKQKAINKLRKIATPDMLEV